MNKKIIVISVLVVLVLTGTGFASYSRYNNDIKFGVGKPTDPNAPVYVEELVCYCEGDLSEKQSEMAKKLSEAEKGIHEDMKNFIAPTKITVKVEVKDGKTFITYSGTATTKTEGTKEYLREEVVDFVFTKDIPEELKD